MSPRLERFGGAGHLQFTTYLLTANAFFPRGEQNEGRLLTITKQLPVVLQKVQLRPFAARDMAPEVVVAQVESKAAPRLDPSECGFLAKGGHFSRRILPPHRRPRSIAIILLAAKTDGIFVSQGRCECPYSRDTARLKADTQETIMLPLYAGARPIPVTQRSQALFRPRCRSSKKFGIESAETRVQYGV
jgi:hypothetical protein